MESITDSQERNLQSLKAEFHDRGKAAKGLQNILNHIKKGKLKRLADLLDHHDHHKDGYWGQELVQRFQVDALIEFYNLLLVAHAAGYIPGDFGTELNQEMEAVLSCESVIPYYKKHYPYKMAGYALLYAKDDTRKLSARARSGDSAIFNSFAALNRALKRDDDMEIFMGMLDHVIYNGYGVSDVIKILGSAKILEHSLNTKHQSEADMGVIGFIKYSTFLEQLHALMEASEHNPMLQSAMWMFHGYYLERLNKKMSRILSGALNNMEKGLASPEIMKTLMTEMAGANHIKEFNKKELQVIIRQALKQARQDITYVLDPKWGQPLKKFFEKK